MLLIGLDAASQLTNFGYAIGELEAGRIKVSDAGLLSSQHETHAPLKRLARELRNAREGLLAIDAPLGWPVGLAEALPTHRAGEKVSVSKEDLFRRETDRVLARSLKKVPLEIGADRIARAAHSALDVLAMIRSYSDLEIPLAWERTFEGVAAIEVYPGATLRARGMRSSGYKKPEQSNARREIAAALEQEIPDLMALTDQRADIFDACLCLVAAKDFLESETLRPTDLELARREGWIWVKVPRE